jgi:hypothetical protein
MLKLFLAVASNFVLLVDSKTQLEFKSRSGDVYSEYNIM